MSVILHGYRYSVYSWIARFALHEKGVAYRWVEIDPFAEDVPQDYLNLHPFKRVPVLTHGDFVVYETGAITRYIDEAFAGSPLQPDEAAARARQNQILSVIDGYGYWPMVRQVFSHAVFRPRVGRQADAEELRKGLEAAPRVLQALERLADDGPFLIGDSLSLADIHLAPMLSYFSQAPEGAALLTRHSRLQAWWTGLRDRPTLLETAPPLPERGV